MIQLLATSHSIIDPEALAKVIEHSYGFRAPTHCTLLAPGVNDTYRVTSKEQAYVYRVYRVGWRSPLDIDYELQLLLHLRRSGVSVSFPIPKLDGTWSTDLPASEGVRTGVLFSHAAGKVLSYRPEDAFKYGVLVAGLHTAMDSFRTDIPRLQLDLEHLLERPLRAIQPIVERQGNWPFLSQLAERLRREVRGKENQLEPGICHGDLHGHNVHQDEHGNLTIFDFDCGGPGWRAYDLAVYRWAVDLHAKDREPWDAFLRGYRTGKDVQQVDLEVIPVFVAIRTLWLLGMQAEQVSLRGSKYVESFIAGGTQALQKWDPLELGSVI